MTSGPSFRIGGIPVRIDVSFLVIAVMLGLGARSGVLLVSWVAIVTGSVLLHELGHAVAFRRFGHRPEILLQGMGGLTTGTPGLRLAPSRDVVVSLAGPLTGLVLLGLPALWLSRASAALSPRTHTILSDLVFVNIAWSVLNLLPVLPLDGGRVSAALLEQRNGPQGARQAHLLSTVVAAAGGVVALMNGYMFGAVFAGFFAAFNLSRLSAVRNARLGADLVQGWQALGRGDLEAAAAAAEQVLADRPSAAMMVGANELLAWTRLVVHDAAGAHRAVERVPPGQTVDPMLLAALAVDAGRAEEALALLEQAYRARQFGPAAAMVANVVTQAALALPLADRLLAPGGAGPDSAALFAAHLHRAGRYSEAIAVGQRAFEAGSGDGAQLAYNLACSHARAGEAAAALRWLGLAVDAGFDDASQLDRDPDLADLRHEDGYRLLQRRLRPGA